MYGFRALVFRPLAKPRAMRALADEGFVRGVLVAGMGEDGKVGTAFERQVVRVSDGLESKGVFKGRLEALLRQRGVDSAHG